MAETYLLNCLFYFFSKNLIVFGILLWDGFKPSTLNEINQKVIFLFVDIIDPSWKS